MPTPTLTPDPAVFASRAADWRIGPVVYQVFVDRFVPPSDPATKARCFVAPRKFNPDWAATPHGGPRVPELGCSAHELEFWGGDLAGVRSKLDYVKALGVDVLYLNPICRAYTNHKYDAQDWNDISPEYGTRDDVKSLAADCHARGMKVMLDGVFNHMGRTAPIFKEAQSNPASPHRAWFYFDERCKAGYRAWANVPNLPEVNLENPEVRRFIWESPDSVVRSYLRDGIDGWRLDVAFDLGPEMLAGITKAAHDEKPGSAVIGEVWNYPAGWMPAHDGLMNFHFRQIMLEWFDAKLSGARACRLMDRAIADAGIENILKCWVVLDNHDTARLKHRLPEQSLRRLARVMQFTLPGSPCVYYGSEVEMDGGDDPANRAPMRWDMVSDDNDDLKFFRRLIRLRADNPALRVGDWARLDTDKLMAFQRTTDRWEQTVIVVANVEALPVTEIVPIRDGRIMNFGGLVDALSGAEIKVHTGLCEVEVPGRTAMVLVPKRSEGPGVEYSPYKRVR